MISYLLKQLNRVPQPWRLIIFLTVCFAALSVLFLFVNQVQSCGYKKARQKYDQERTAWTTERTKLIADAEAKEKRIAELEPKAIAFEALAENNKRVDAKLAQQIDEVAKNAANDEARAQIPTDCRVRAQRVCNLLRANNIPHDCGAITRETCGNR